MMMYVAMLLFITSMFLIATSAILDLRAMETAIEAFGEPSSQYSCSPGTLFLLLSVLLTAIEVHRSNIQRSTSQAPTCGPPD